MARHPVSAATAGRVITGRDDRQGDGDRAAGGSTPARPDPSIVWIEHVAVWPGGSMALSAGKQPSCAAKGSERIFEALDRRGIGLCAKGFRPGDSPSTCPRSGFRLPAPRSPKRSHWRRLASCRDVRPDGRFLITAMQEPTLHGWRLADRKDMRMQGSRLAFVARRTRDVKWLASLGVGAN